MEHSQYGLSVTLPVSFDTAVADTTEALKAEGFGVLTTIDVQQTLKTKLNRDFRKYVILGACNPALADRALHAELEIGLLLPCNVVIRRTGEVTVVEAINPEALVTLTENPAMTSLSQDLAAALNATLETLRDLA